VGNVDPTFLTTALGVDPEVMPSVTVRLSVHTAAGTIELFVTLCERNGRPYQVSLTTKSAEYAEYLMALETLITMLIQSGKNFADISAALQSVHSAFTGHMKKGGWCPSLAARIGEVLVSARRPS